MRVSIIPSRRDGSIQAKVLPLTKGRATLFQGTLVALSTFNIKYSIWGVRNLFKNDPERRGFIFPKYELISSHDDPFRAPMNFGRVANTKIH